MGWFDDHCKECSYLVKQGHSVDCSLQSDQDKIKNHGKLVQWRRQDQSWLQKARDRAQLWEGKFRAVKHENNKLRQRNRVLERYIADLDLVGKLEDFLDSEDKSQ